MVAWWRCRAVRPRGTVRLVVVTGLYSSNIKEWWPDAKPFIERALERSMGEYEAEDIRAALEINDMQMWVAVDDEKVIAVMVTQIVNYPRKRFCDLVLGAGTRLDEWKPGLRMIQDWAKFNKCDALRIFGRKGWVRSLGMAENFTVMSMEV